MQYRDEVDPCRVWPRACEQMLQGHRCIRQEKLDPISRLDCVCPAVASFDQLQDTTQAVRYSAIAAMPVPITEYGWGTNRAPDFQA